MTPSSCAERKCFHILCYAQRKIILQQDCAKRHGGSGWSEIVQLDKCLSTIFKQSSHNILKIRIGSDHYTVLPWWFPLAAYQKWVYMPIIYLIYLFPHKFVFLGAMGMCVWVLNLLLLCNCRLDRLLMLCEVWKMGIELGDALLGFGISHDQHMKEPALALWINMDAQDCNGDREENSSIGRGWFCKEDVIHWSLLMLSFAIFGKKLVKINKNKKTSIFTTSETPLCGQPSHPPALAGPYFSRGAVCPLGSSFGARGRAPSPLWAAACPSLPSRGHPTP